MGVIEELRQHRIFNMAIFDIVATIIVALILQNYIWQYPTERVKERTTLQYVTFALIMIITFIGLGIIFHWIFGVKSALSAYLGINNMPIRKK